MKEVSVVIPAYNEAGAIAAVVARVHHALHEKFSYEVLVIDDGSTDRTKAEAERVGARVISNPLNMGYGFSLKRGFREAQYECVIITDADGTYPVERIPDLVATFDQGFDMVVGARQGRAYWSSWVKGVARIGFKWMSEYVVGNKIPDINSGFRAIRRSFMLPILPDLSNSFSFSTSSTLIFMLKRYFVTYVPITYYSRTGKSKVNYVRDALIATQIMVEIIARYNPIKLFLFLAAWPLLLAVIFLGVAWVQLSIILFSVGVIALLFSLLILSLGFFAAAFKKV